MLKLGNESGEVEDFGRLKFTFLVAQCRDASCRRMLQRSERRSNSQITAEVAMELGIRGGNVGVDLPVVVGSPRNPLSVTKETLKRRYR